jgi:hypothetical protein
VSAINENKQCHAQAHLVFTAQAMFQNNSLP